MGGPTFNLIKELDTPGCFWMEWLCKRDGLKRVTEIGVNVPVLAFQEAQL